jgi:hypothetical protein
MKNLFFTIRILIAATLCLVIPLETDAKDNTVKVSKIRLATMELTPKGVSKVVADAVSDLLRSDIVDQGGLLLLSAARWKPSLKSRGCNDRL